MTDHYDYITSVSVRSLKDRRMCHISLLNDLMLNMMLITFLTGRLLHTTTNQLKATNVKEKAKQYMSTIYKKHNGISV